MLRLGTQTGSVINHIESRDASAQPAVGMGATRLGWSDRHPYTVIEVLLFKSGAKAGQVRAVCVQEDNATRTDKNGMSDSQSYEYTPNPDAPVEVYRACKGGVFKDAKGSRLMIGKRSKYYDYSF